MTIIVYGDSFVKKLGRAILISINEDERAVLIDVYMPFVRMANVNRAVNRTVTLPAWLNAATLERNINLQQVLQDALKSQLNLG